MVTILTTVAVIPMEQHSELVRARERIEELERLLGMRMPKPRSEVFNGLSGLGWKLLGLLVKQPLVTREYAFIALYGDRSDEEQPTSLRIIDTNVTRLNKAISPHARIKSEPGTGYLIDKTGRESLKALIEKD